MNNHVKTEMLSNRHTDRQTHRPSTVTLAVHACRGLKRKDPAIGAAICTFVLHLNPTSYASTITINLSLKLEQFNSAAPIIKTLSFYIPYFLSKTLWPLFFHCSFCTATIRGQLLFQGGVYISLESTQTSTTAG